MSDVPYFFPALRRTVAFVGVESWWELPTVIQSGSFGDEERHPIFDIDFNKTESWLEFHELDRNMTTDAAKLTKEFLGLHEVNITVIDQNGAWDSYIWEILVLEPSWSTSN